MTSLSITQTLMNNYASILFINDNFYDKTYLDTKSSLTTYLTSLSYLVDFVHLGDNYTNTHDLTTGYYDKTQTDNLLINYTTNTSLQALLSSYAQTSVLNLNFYGKTETDTLLADKSINIGDIGLPSMLDIGTSGYTNSRIRCNADVGGYTGYAELKAANSYDMFLNLSTTRTDGGWMYFGINNDDYMQLSSSGNKVNIYKDTSISENLDVGQDQAQTSIKAYVNHIGKTGYVEIEAKLASQGFIRFN